MSALRGLIVFVVAFAVAVGVVSPVAAAAPKPPPAAAPAVAPPQVRPEAFGPGAASSPDVAVDGFGDPRGYHVQVAAEKSGFAWRDLVVLHPDGLDEQNWYGYQCVSGDGKYAAVAVLPGSAVNIAVGRDRGAFAYSVELATGRVRPVASGVGLKYYSPACGTGDSAVFTLNLGRDQQTTELVTADLATGKVTGTTVVAGQVTSAVPAGDGLLAARGATVVSVPAGGTPQRPATPVMVAAVGASPFGLRAAVDGGVDLLSTVDGSGTTSVQHEHAGHLTTLGSGPRDRVALFAGRAGHNTIVGAGAVDRKAVRSVDAHALPRAASVASLDGDAVFTASTTDAPAAKRGADAGATAPTGSRDDTVVAAATGQLLHVASSAETSSPVFSQVSPFLPPGVAGSPGPDTNIQPAPQEHRTDQPIAPPVAPTTPGPVPSSPPAPAGKPATTTTPAPTHGPVTPNAPTSSAPKPTAAPSGASPQVRPAAFEAPLATQAAATSTQTPTCAVPRLDPNKQDIQPSNAQVDWAVQMAEQGLLTGTQYQRPAGYANLGLVAYAPNDDFPQIALQHPTSSTWNSVPRSVFQAIMAQESNWNQASWHALPGVSGDPLIADYYGAHGGITSIDYSTADCGYGISQVTSGMHVGDTSLSAHGQIKVAVDYQENIAAGLQILQQTWNQLYTSGIIANNGDPKYLENWYFAAWAYNSGIQPTAKYGNTTGCTPSPTCVGPDGTWGLGWTNNPKNPDYPPTRAPFLQSTYADAAHPGDWPYQEKIMGWMASPLIRYQHFGYDTPNYNGGKTWPQIPGINSFCTSDNKCDPNYVNTTNPGASYCTLSDFECWWHQPVTWIPDCATTCATAVYQYITGSTEPTYADPHPATCSIDNSKVPSSAIVVDDLASPTNVVGCGAPNWSQGGTFNYTYGTNAAGDPIGAIDTHQLGSGLGGHILFSHTEDGTNASLINTGTWTPNLPSLQYYKIKIHFPATGGAATNVVYTINPGGGVNPFKYRVNQAWGSEQWATIATIAMQPGGNVVLTNNAPAINAGTSYADYDVAFDAIAFIPMGGTPGSVIGGPNGVLDAPKGSNPAFVNCGCVARTAGDPVNTQTGYFGESVTDIATPGRAPGLGVSRSYASALADPAGPNGSAAHDGPFGWGWSYSYGMSSTTDGTTGNVTIHQEDGSQVVFIKNGSTYAPSTPRIDATLTVSGPTYLYTRRGKEIYGFDTASGRLNAVTNQAGWNAATPQYATQLAYPSGPLSTVTDPGGRKYTFTWTGNHITTIVDDTGREVDYGYDTSGDLTDVWGVNTTRAGSTRADNDHTVYGYNTATHLITSMRTPNNFGGPAGAVTSMVYDTNERVTTQTDPLGRVTTFTYGPNGGLQTGQTQVTDPAGHKTLDTYNADGLLTSETKGAGTPDAGTWSYTYDPVTLGISTATDPNGNATTYSYDDHGNKIAISDARGFTTSALYDASDNLQQTTDPAGIQTSTTYNTAGAPTQVSVSQPGQSAEASNSNPSPTVVRTVSYGYSDAAHPADRTSTTDANGNTSNATYDAFGDVISTTDPSGNVAKLGYDTGRGLLTSTVTPNGVAAGVAPGCSPPSTGCSAFTYDPAGRKTSSTDPLGHKASTAYDADGNTVSATDANNHTSTTAYDAADQKAAVTAADQTVTKTDYTLDGQIADTIDGANNKTTYGYDGQGRQNTVTDPDNHITTSVHDPAGRITKVTAPGGQTATNSYDVGDELTGTTYSDTTPAVSGITYDPDGRRLSVTDGTGTSQWTYDSFGEIATHTTGTGNKVGYGYDADGHVTSISYPGQATAVTRVFDKTGRLTGVTDWNNNSTTFGYNADSQLTTTAYPNSTTVTNTYDPGDVLSGTTLTKGAQTLAGLTFTRDANNQVTGQTPTGLPGTARTYGYTTTNQLASATPSGGPATAYGYDSATNPTNLAGTQQTFDPSSQLCWTLSGSTVPSPTCASPPAGATTFGFDTNGNRATMTLASGVKSTYTYNGINQLTSAATPAGSASYGYSADGLRTSKTVGASTQQFTWDDTKTPNLLTDGTNNWIYGPGNTPIEQVTGVTTLWYFHDQLGSTRALTDTTGTITGSYDYTEYGTPTHTGTATTPLQYTSGYTDTETGYVYLRARYYDPATGGFTSQDPAFAKTLSWYGYGSNDPLDRIDPNGEFAWAALAFAIPGVGEILAAAAIVVIIVVAVVVVAAAVVAAVDTTENYFASRRNPDWSYVPAPREGLTGFPKARPVPGKTPRQGGGKPRQRWINDDGCILEWDYQHGAVEKYSKSGRDHLGEFDPETGEQIKPGDPTRRVQK